MPKFATDSKWLKWQELDGQDWVLTIASFKQENLGQGDKQEMKWVLYFKEMPKGFALNATNGKTISKILGSDEMNDWVGKRITLYSKDDIEYAGELVNGIRVRPKAPLAA